MARRNDYRHDCRDYFDFPFCRKNAWSECTYPSVYDCVGRHSDRFRSKPRVQPHLWSWALRTLKIVSKFPSRCPHIYGNRSDHLVYHPSRFERIKMKLISALISSLVFGIGISVLGMMDPAKVLNFFWFRRDMGYKYHFCFGWCLDCDFLWISATFAALKTAFQWALSSTAFDSNWSAISPWLYNLWYWMGQCRVLSGRSNTRSSHGPLGNYTFSCFCGFRICITPRSRSNAGGCCIVTKQNWKLKV